MVKSESVRILVIEDEVKLATHLSRALEAEGHEARVVHEGKVALVEAREGAIGLDRILSTTERFEHQRSNAKTASSDSRVARQRSVHLPTEKSPQPTDKFVILLGELSFV
jgi:DNA-binding response OmpR family regulator